MGAVAKVATRKKKSGKKTGLSRFQKYGILYIGAILILFASIGFLFFKTHTRPSSALEGSKHDMVKIPPDVKKKLQQQQATPSLSASIRVPILLYHYVEYVQDKKDTIRQSLNITPNTFEEQIKTLQNAGYTFMTAGELADVLDAKAQLPPNPILLTFDDGHWDLDTVVLPILKKYHVKATAYIISGFLGGSDFMTPEQLNDVIASGLVEIGAHTVHHIALARQPANLVTTEVEQSKIDLETIYHVHVISFAYPSGSFDEQAIHAVKQAGYETAVSTIPGINQSQLNRFFLYRIRPGYRIGNDLLSYLQQNYFRAY